MAAFRPTISERNAINYIIESLVSRSCIPFVYDRVSISVDTDSARIHIDTDTHHVTSDSIDKVIDNLRELVAGYVCDNTRSFAFYAVPKAYSPTFKLINHSSSSSTIQIYDVRINSPSTIIMSTAILRIVRECLLGMVSNNRSVTVESGMFLTRITYDYTIITVSKVSEQKMLEMINSILGPIPGFNLRTYMCVIGDDSVKPLIEPMLPYYGGKYLNSEEFTGIGNSYVTVHTATIRKSHHHYMFPSEQYAAEAYQKIHRLPGVDLAMTMYCLHDPYE